VITVGRPQANLALTSFEVHRSSLVNARLEASAQVTNFSDKDQKIKVVVKGTGTTLASRDMVVGAGKTANLRGCPISQTTRPRSTRVMPCRSIIVALPSRKDRAIFKSSRSRRARKRL
jgi:hypothetical protein